MVSKSVRKPLDNNLSRNSRRRNLPSRSQSASRFDIHCPHHKRLKSLPPIVFGSRFPRSASAPERVRIRRRPLQLPRRLNSPLRNPSGTTTTETCYSSQRIGRTTPSRRASASARSSKTRKTPWRCAGAHATDGRVSSSPGSVPTKPRKFDALTSSQTASTTANFVKVCLLYSVAWTLKILTGNNFARSVNLAPNPSPHSRCARPTYRRASTPTFRLTCNSISPATTLSPACATHPLATLRRKRARRRIS